MIFVNVIETKNVYFLLGDLSIPDIRKSNDTQRSNSSVTILPESKEKSDSISIPMPSTTSEKKLINIKSLLKKTLQSRLTRFQLLLLILNIIALTIIIVLAIVTRRQNQSENKMSPRGKLIR